MVYLNYYYQNNNNTKDSIEMFIFNKSTVKFFYPYTSLLTVCTLVTFAQTKIVF